MICFLALGVADSEGGGGCFAEAYVRVDVGVPVFDEAPGFSCNASVLKVSEKNWIFHSVKCRGQIIEAGVDGVTIMDEFGDGFLAREFSIHFRGTAHAQCAKGLQLVTFCLSVGIFLFPFLMK